VQYIAKRGLYRRGSKPGPDLSLTAEGQA
jgi:hypothetical protein